MTPLVLERIRERPPSRILTFQKHQQIKDALKKKRLAERKIFLHPGSRIWPPMIPGRNMNLDLEDNKVRWGGEYLVMLWWRQYTDCVKNYAIVFCLLREKKKNTIIFRTYNNCLSCHLWIAFEPTLFHSVEVERYVNFCERWSRSSVDWSVVIHNKCFLINDGITMMKLFVPCIVASKNKIV